MATVCTDNSTWNKINQLLLSAVIGITPLYCIYYKRSAKFKLLKITLFDWVTNPVLKYKHTICLINQNQMQLNCEVLPAYRLISFYVCIVKTLKLCISLLDESRSASHNQTISGTLFSLIFHPLLPAFLRNI